MSAHGAVGKRWEEGALDLGNQAEEEHTTAACWNNKSD